MLAFEFLYGALPFIVLGLCFIIPVEQSKRDCLCIMGGAFLGFVIALTFSLNAIIEHAYFAAAGALTGELIAYLFRRRDRRPPTLNHNHEPAQSRLFYYIIFTCEAFLYILLQRIDRASI